MRTIAHTTELTRWTDAFIASVIACVNPYVMGFSLVNRQLCRQYAQTI